MEDVKQLLHVSAQRDDRPGLWLTFAIGIDSPTISLLSSVDSYEDAQSRADRAYEGRLRIEQGAWDQMVAAGKAPEVVPNKVTII